MTEKRKGLPAAETEKQKSLPPAEQPEKGLPQVGSPENSIVIGGRLVEIKPTRLRYQRNRTAAFYKILELYPLADVLAHGSGRVRRRPGRRQGAHGLAVAVTDDAELVRANYDSWIQGRSNSYWPSSGA